MINPQELRIGNCVNAEISNGEDIIEISKGKITGILSDSIYLNTVKFEFRHLLPILLTEEWLLRAGFTKEVNDDDFDYWLHKKIGREIWQHDMGFCHNLGLGGDINYVHQLQNLIFSLTGEELTIKD